MAAKVLSSAVAEVSSSRTTYFVSNVGRREAFRDAQSLSFFECTRLPMAAQRMTSMARRGVFLTALVKARLALMETTAGYSRDTARAKVVVVSLKYLFLADT